MNGVCDCGRVLTRIELEHRRGCDCDLCAAVGREGACIGLYIEASTACSGVAAEAWAAAPRYSWVAARCSCDWAAGSAMGGGSRRWLAGRSGRRRGHGLQVARLRGFDGVFWKASRNGAAPREVGSGSRHARGGRRHGCALQGRARLQDRGRGFPRGRIDAARRRSGCARTRAGRLAGREKERKRERRRERKHEDMQARAALELALDEVEGAWAAGVGHGPLFSAD